jgi:putative tricarboxylic transport membrane protein
MFLLFVLVVGSEAVTYNLGENIRMVGPGFFPVTLLAILGLLSIALLIGALKNWSQGLRAPWPTRFQPLVLVVSTVVAYAILLPWLGFLITTFLFSVVLFRFGYPGKWMLPLLGAAITSLAAMLVFKVWLNTQFPPGLLGI